MILLLVTIAAQALPPLNVPIQARLVSIEDRRTGNQIDRYDRVRLEFTNAGAVSVPLRVCPQDARFETAYLSGPGKGAWRPDETAFAASIGRQYNWRRSCQTLTLAPGRAQTVNLFARNGRTFGDVRRLNLTTSAGAFIFTSPMRTAAR